jgi:hypothetical protein
MAVIVVAHSEDLLAVHVPVGAPLRFATEHPLGRHPWAANSRWQGTDIVMVQRTDTAHSAWFSGAEGVYVNLQDPIRPTRRGFDTFDHELDIVVRADGSWVLKDEDQLASAVTTGRFTEDEAKSIRAEGDNVTAMLSNGSFWWRDSSWGRWSPPAVWPAPVLPDDWAVD